MDNASAMGANPFRKLRSLGLIALLVFTLGQTGLLVHKATSDHPAEDVCELCSSFDRLAATPESPGARVSELVVALLLLALAGSLTLTQTVRIHRPRAPPTL